MWIVQPGAVNTEPLALFVVFADSDGGEKPFPEVIFIVQLVNIQLSPHVDMGGTAGFVAVRHVKGDVQVPEVPIGGDRLTQAELPTRFVREAAQALPDMIDSHTSAILEICPASS